MKKKDKANLMKIIIGGLVLVGLYFGYQAMTGGSSPFSMAGSGFTGKPGSQADLQTLKLRIIMPSSNRSNMHEDEVAIKATAKFRNHGPQKAYGAEAVFVISENLKFIGNNQPPYNSRGCRPTVGDQQRIVCPLYALKPNLRTKTRYVSVRSNKCDEEGVITVSVQLPPGNTTDLVPDNNTMRKSFKIRGCPVVDDTSSVPTATTTPPTVCAPGRVEVAVASPGTSELPTSGEAELIKAILSANGGDVKVGKIELKIVTDPASPTPRFKRNSIVVRYQGMDIALRPHNQLFLPGETPAIHARQHPAGSLNPVSSTEWEGIISFMEPLRIREGTSKTLHILAWVDYAPSPSSVVTKLKRDEISLITNARRDPIEEPESNSFAWEASCREDPDEAWKNGFYLNGNPVEYLPSSSEGLIKN